MIQEKAQTFSDNSLACAIRETTFRVLSASMEHSKYLDHGQFHHGRAVLQRHEPRIVNGEDAQPGEIPFQVRTPFVKSELIAFATLPEPEEVVNAADIATVSGYGRLWEGGPVSNRLQRVNIFIADADHCKNVYKKISKNIHTSQLCANDPSTSRGSCKGDSGGPLTVNGKLVGLVSWARACSLTTFPTVYTRVSSYINWINEHMA
ncbi:hypothetical protein KM043_016221 [Ampulex compressa]|nr:hypothetical protein KM043_016221 [Ampulex compressa]